MEPRSLYLHIPFCQHRCAYCDFNTYSGQEALIPAYVQALHTEIESLADNQQLIHTVFFGGGTPSLLEPDQIRKILESIRSNFDLDSAAEITLEANPGTISRPYLQELRGIGINRLSIGAQSANPEELRVLERTHSFEETIDAIKNARLAGFDNINLDLMFALPGQTLDRWQRTLDLAIQLNPEHFSLYSLSFEHGTPFTALNHRGLFAIPSQDLAAEMYQMAQDKLQAQGFQHYEISNWAKESNNEQSYECNHNLQYWKNQPYFGLGAGAHGWIDGQRTRNVLAPSAYIKRLSKNQDDLIHPRTAATFECNPIDRRTEMAETMMMGLRLLENGISSSAFKTRFDTSLESIYGQQIESLLEKELVSWQVNGSNNLMLTPKGRNLGNQVFMEFI